MRWPPPAAPVPSLVSHVSKHPAAAVLHDDMLPFCADLGLPVQAVPTDNGREFCGAENHPYELHLDLNGIEHRRTKVRMAKTNGSVERLNGTTLEDFFRIKMHETFHDSIEALQAELEARLIHCNPERPHLGYRNMGRRPVDNRHVIRQPKRVKKTRDARHQPRAPMPRSGFVFACSADQHALRTPSWKMPFRSGHSVGCCVNTPHPRWIGEGSGARIAQLVEQRIENPRVGGSNPSPGTTFS